MRGRVLEENFWWRRDSLRQHFFFNRIVNALCKKVTGVPVRHISSAQQAQEGFRKIAGELAKSPTVNLKGALKFAGDNFDEKNCRLFIRALARIKPGRSPTRYLDDYDMLILLVWDDFDAEYWPPEMVEWIGYDRYNRAVTLRDFPPLCRWTANAARYCINWLMDGSGMKLESRMTQKAYEKRVRGMDLVSQKPLLVRRRDFLDHIFQHKRASVGLLKTPTDSVQNK
jgi:hypothetical protein